MNIEPVYLVAPLKDSAGPTRRHWLAMFGAFCLGAVGGGVAGLAGAGVLRSHGVPSVDPLAELDPELERLRRLVTSGSTHELLAERWHLLINLSGRYADDEVLWTGLDRVVELLMALEPTEETRESMRFAATLIEKSTSDHAKSRTYLLPGLRVR